MKTDYALGLLHRALYGFCLLMASGAQAGWEGYPPLQNRYKEHEFLAACREGNCPAVNFYLEREGVNCNEEHNSGLTHTPVTGLYIASQEGHTQAVSSLIAAGADVGQSCPDDQATPLFIASQNGHTEVVKMLVEAGANPSIAWCVSYPLCLGVYRTPLRQAKFCKWFTLPGSVKRGAYNEIISILSQAHSHSLPPEKNDTPHQTDAPHLLSTMSRLSLSGKPSYRRTPAL